MPYIVDGYGGKAWLDEESFGHLAMNGQTPVVWVESGEPATPSTEAPAPKRKGWPKGKPRRAQG